MDGPKVGMRMTVWRYYDGVGTYDVMARRDIPEPYRHQAKVLPIIPTCVIGRKVVRFREMKPRYTVLITSGEIEGCEEYTDMLPKALQIAIAEILTRAPLCEFKVVVV